MILFFSDLHKGIKSYSQQLSSGLFTAEEEARIALDYTYERIAKPDIDLVLFGGDWFHTNQPTSENIKDSISWIKKVDKLGKPFYIIPGNHDASMYSNSIKFIESLTLQNTFLVDPSFYKRNKCLDWNGWKIQFAPYRYAESMKDKEQDLHTDVINLISTIESKSIIVTHIQETTAKIGSESIMISKGVDIIDLDAIHATKDILLFSGHMHKHQIYKKGFMTVCYPGNTFYHDETDCNQDKGFVLFSPTGELSFESIPTIRKFIKIYVPKDSSIEDTLNRRFSERSVVFVSLQGTKDLKKEEEIKTLLENKGLVLGTLKYVKDSVEAELALSSVNTALDPYRIFEERIKIRQDLSDKIKLDTIAKGKFFIDQVKLKGAKNGN